MYAEIVLKSSKADTAFGYSKIYLTEFEIMITDGVFIWTELTKLIHLDTFDFQAKEFYKKQGYVVFGKLDDCPENHCRYFMKKLL